VNIFIVGLVPAIQMNGDVGTGPSERVRGRRSDRWVPKQGGPGSLAGAARSEGNGR